MNFLFLNQFFWPDAAPTGQLLTDLAVTLDAQGHSVTVICASSIYESAGEAAVLPVSIMVRRSPAVQFKRGAIGRLLSYGCYWIGAMFLGLRGPPPDVIVSLTTPPLLSLVGQFLKRMRRARHYIWEMDLYPDIAVDVQMLHREAILTQLLAAVAKHVRRRSDGVIVLGECMRDRLIRSGVEPERIHMAENWTDGLDVKPSPPAPGGLIRLFYSGNLGLAHEVGTIRGTIELMHLDPRFRFIFAGGGPKRAALEHYCRNRAFANVEFRPYSSKADLGGSLASACIGVVTQEPETLGSVVPSKVYGIMAAARPVLFIGPRKATPALIIERFGCGWHIEPGDSAGLVELLNRLAQDRSEMERRGNSARAAFEIHYHTAAGVARVAGIIGLPLTRAEVEQKRNNTRAAGARAATGTGEA